MGTLEVFGIGFLCFFLGGIFGFMTSALCVASSKNDICTDDLHR